MAAVFLPLYLPEGSGEWPISLQPAAQPEVRARRPWRGTLWWLDGQRRAA